MPREVEVFDSNAGKFTKRPAETVSELLGGAGYNRDRLIDDSELAQNAADTAKPFMDVAVDLYETRVGSWLMGGVESEEDRQVVADETDIQSLVEYARRKSDRAIELGQKVALTHNENIILEAYKAHIELEEVVNDSRYEYFGDTPELQQAIDAVEEKISVAKDKETRNKWVAVANKLMRYQESFEYDDKISRDEFWPSIDNAVFLLDMATDDVRSTEAVQVGDIYKDTKMMQEKTEMLRILQSLSEQTASSEQPLDISSGEEKAYTGLTPEQVATAKRRLDDMTIKSSRVEMEPNNNTIELSDDWAEREEQVAAWLEENGTGLTPDAVNVAKQYVVKSIEMMIRMMKKGRDQNPNLESSRYNRNLTGIFGSSVSMNPTTGIHEILAKAYFKHHPEVTELSPSDYGRIRLDAIANALGIKLEDINNFDSTF